MKEKSRKEIVVHSPNRNRGATRRGPHRTFYYGAREAVVLGAGEIRTGLWQLAEGAPAVMAAVMADLEGKRRHGRIQLGGKQRSGLRASAGSAWQAGSQFLPQPAHSLAQVIPGNLSSCPNRPEHMSRLVSLPIPSIKMHFCSSSGLQCLVQAEKLILRPVGISLACMWLGGKLLISCYIYIW